MKSVSDKQVWERLERIRFALGLLDRDFAKLLELKPEEYLEYREARTALPVTSILPLLSEANLSIERFMVGDIDIPAVEAHYRKDFDFVPERYLRGAFSRRRTPVHILGFLESRFGWQARAQALSHFQVTESAIGKVDELINLNFSADLASYLNRRGHGAEFFYQAGLHSSVVNWNSAFAETLRAQSSLKSVYEVGIAELMNFVEQNHEYRLTHLTETHATLVSRQRNEVLAALEARKFGNSLLCQLRLGVGAAFVRYLGLPEARAVEVRCVHRGDPHCQFEYDFEEAGHLKKSIRPMFGRPIPSGTA